MPNRAHIFEYRSDKSLIIIGQISLRYTCTFELLKKPETFGCLGRHRGDMIVPHQCIITHYTVLEAMTRVYGKTENSTPRKYKMDKDIQTPPRIYDYVAELSCCAKSEQNRLGLFCWGNRGSLSFFTHTHTDSQTKSNKYFHLA